MGHYALEMGSEEIRKQFEEARRQEALKKYLESAQKTCFPPPAAPQKPILIGIAGRMHNGKDTFGNFLKERLHDKGKFSPCMYAFADPIKAGLRAMFGWSNERVNSELKDKLDAELGFSPRFAMQTLGTDWGRGMLDHNSVWIKLAKKRWDFCRSTGMIVTDVRFDDEAEWIRSEGGTIVHLERRRFGKEIAALDSIVSGDVLNHSSEKGVVHRLDDYAAASCETLIDLEIEAIRFAEWYLNQRKGAK